MSQTKGNVYPFWYISNDNEVFAVDNKGTAHSKSKAGFAREIGISIDGTVWVLSNIPDPDGGGAKIFWSNGDNNWNEIATSDPGGMRLTGAGVERCLYMTSSGEIYTLKTDGTILKEYSDLGIIRLAAGGRYIWAIMPLSKGEKPILRYFDVTDQSAGWKTFAGNISPRSISVSGSGDCFGVIDSNPMYFSIDGKTSGSAGTGADGITLNISYCNFGYIVTDNANEKGNQIMKLVNEPNGDFVDTRLRGRRVAASFYK